MALRDRRFALPVTFAAIGAACSSVPAPARAPADGRGVVVTMSPPANEVGRAVLQAGGNAVDAAVAVGFALAVTLPGAGNVAGGGFMVIRFPDGRATTIDFRERAPATATPEMFLDSTGAYSAAIHTTGSTCSGCSPNNAATAALGYRAPVSVAKTRKTSTVFAM